MTAPTLAEMIPMVSPFTTSGTGAIPTATYTQFVLWAEETLVQEDPGLPTETRLLCKALLICHLNQTRLGYIEAKQVNPGDWLYVNPGTTSYYIRYKEELKRFEDVASQTDYTAADAVTRADANMPEFALDQADPISFFTED